MNLKQPFMLRHTNMNGSIGVFKNAIKNSYERALYDDMLLASKEEYSSTSPHFGMMCYCEISRNVAEMFIVRVRSRQSRLLKTIIKISEFDSLRFAFDNIMKPYKEGWRLWW